MSCSGMIQADDDGNDDDISSSSSSSSSSFNVHMFSHEVGRAMSHAMLITSWIGARGIKTGCPSCRPVAAHGI